MLLAGSQVFVPPAQAEPPAEHESEWEDIPVTRFIQLAKTLLFGWPLYLATNVSGRSYDGYASHFDPYSPIFSKKERSEILVSDIVLAAVAYGLYLTAQTFGWGWFCKVRAQHQAGQAQHQAGQA